MSFNFNGNLPLDIHVATWLDSSLPNYNELLVNYKTFEQAYGNRGFHYESTNRHILYSTSYFNGLWASEQYTENSGYKYDGTDLMSVEKWARAGSAPLPETNNGLVWPSQCFVHGCTGPYPSSSTSGSGNYIWIAYFDGCLRYCQTTSKSAPSSGSYKAFGTGDGCNVAIITLVGGGGGGGGGHSWNPWLGFSTAASGAGGGGGGYISFLYKFNRNTTVNQLSSSYKLVITLGGGGTAGTAGSDDSSSTGGAGGTGGTTRAEEYTTQVTTVIAEAYGGNGGSGGSRKSEKNATAGTGGSNSYTGSARSCSIQTLTGRNGGNGLYRHSTDGSGYGGDGGSFSDTSYFGFYSNGTAVCSSSLIRQGYRGTGSPARDYQGYTFFRVSGGGGGASPYSCSNGNSSAISEFLGTGGQGGGASCNDGTGAQMFAGTAGHPGCCSITFN